MLFWTMKWVIMSVVMILIMHHLYIFFMDTLTVPMNKDFIHKPVEKYKEMLDTIRDMPKSQHAHSEYSLDNIIPSGNSSAMPAGNSMPAGNINDTHNTANMQNELQTFLNELKQSRGSNTIPTHNISSGAR